MTRKNIGDDAVSIVVPNAVVYLPFEELVDKEKERERLQKEEDRLKKRSHAAKECSEMKNS